MLNRFHPVYHGYTYLAGSRVDIERLLEPELDLDDTEDLVDQFSEPPQFFERLSPITTTVGEKEIRGRNWTDMMIQSYRVFGRIFMRATAFLSQALVNDHNERTMVPFMSMAVDPDTLTRLIEYDYEAGENSYSKLCELYETGAVAPTLTVPFHPVLPLLPSEFDRRLCIRLGLKFFAPILRTYQRYLGSIDQDIMVIPWWVPEAALNHEVIRILVEETEAFCAAEKLKNTHIVLLADADLARGVSLDKLMKTWCQVDMGKSGPKDVSIIFRDPAFSEWMMQSHPSIKKIIDRTIAKVDAGLDAKDVGYTWAHFESLEALTYSPRDAINYEQRILKLCELGYLSLSPDTFIRRKLNGRFGIADNEPFPIKLNDPNPETDPLGEENRYGQWTGWGLDKDGERKVMPNAPYMRKTRKGKERQQGSPCWKIAWNLTRNACFAAVAGDPEKMNSGVLGLLANLASGRGASAKRERVEAFLVEYGLVYWREHFIHHDMSEADIRIDEIAQATLRKGSKNELSMHEVTAASTAAQAYFFLVDSCNSYGLAAENLDQRAMYQNAVMLSLAVCNGVAAWHYLDETDNAEALLDVLEEQLLNFGEAYERYDLEQYGVSKQAWNKALQSEIEESKMNLVERAARRVAARHLGELGYDDRFDPDDEDLSTNVGHHWTTEVDIENYQWANPYFCGVREA